MNAKLTPEEYIQTRVDDQINWMDAKSLDNQRMHMRLTVSQLILAAIIPVLTAVKVERFPQVPLVIGLLGAIVAIIAGLLALKRYQANWIGYRVACEALKREKFAFQTSVAPYDGPDPFKQFVSRTEAILAKENSGWAEQMQAPSATAR
jgi:hypothetical protein